METKELWMDEEFCKKVDAASCKRYIVILCGITRNADPVFRACVSLVPENWDFRTCWCGKAPVFTEIKAKGGNLRV